MPSSRSMPRRRDPSNPADAPTPSGGRRPRSRQSHRGKRRWFPSRRGWLAILVASGGALAGFGTITLVWPQRDRAYEPPPQVTPATLAPKPQRPVTVLVVGLDADRLGAPSNGAAPPGRPNADVLLLVRVLPSGPLQVLNLPTELAVRVPGQKQPQSLGSLYRLGGVALTADAVRELTGLHAPSPDRYLLLPRAALRQLVNGVGGLEIDPPHTMRYEDRAQKLRIDLQGGLQRLSGLQAEHLLRFRDPVLGLADRRSNQQLFLDALRDRMRQNDPLAALPALLTSLEANLETNLTMGEALSLLAAGLDSPGPIAFSSLPLDPPRRGHGDMRQLSENAPRQVWRDSKP